MANDKEVTKDTQPQPPRAGRPPTPMRSMENPFLQDEETVLPFIPDDEDWHYCFIRHKLGNEDDGKNIVSHTSGKLPYELVTFDMLAKDLQRKFEALKLTQGQYAGHIQVGDVILGRTPQRLYKQYIEATQIRADRMSQSLREQVLSKNALAAGRKSGIRIEDDSEADGLLPQQAIN